MVSLRTACPRAARHRVALLNLRFESLCVRLFGNPEVRRSLDVGDAKRIFDSELLKALAALEDEREDAVTLRYEFGDFTTFLAVHEQVYRYLSQFGTGIFKFDWDQWLVRVGSAGEEVARLSFEMLKKDNFNYFQTLDDSADTLIEHGISEGNSVDGWHLEHASRLRWDARIAAILEYRRSLDDPGARYARFDYAPVERHAPLPDRLATEEVAAALAPVSIYAGLDAVETGTRFIDENPKLQRSDNGKRKAAWTDKTRSQFETAMRLLRKSMGDKPFVALTAADLRRLLGHFDGLPPNHHKTPRHRPMSLDDICAEGVAGVKAGELEKSALGLNTPTMNRHFRFIRMAHDWIAKHYEGTETIDWSPFSFEDERNARDQRLAFPIDAGRRLFTLPPWRGCESLTRRLKPGRQIYHDSHYWVVPILWYSGMRREEVCKLQLADIGTDADGIAYFDVANTAAGRVKTESSKRKIPIAEELLRLGLLEFVAAQRRIGEVLLFPELQSETRTMGDSFYNLSWVKLLAIAGLPDGLTMHGIRHMVADELKFAGVSEEIRADLLGHANDSETAGRYSKASRLKVLRDVVNKIPCVTSTLQPEAIALPAAGSETGAGTRRRLLATGRSLTRAAA